MALPTASEDATAGARPPRRFDWRLAAGVLLLAAAVPLTWSTVVGLEARRELRFDLAEISHAKYDVLNASRWVAIITPILDAKIDALDLGPAQGASLRPMVQNALYRLLDDVKTQMTAKPATPATPPKPAAPAAGGFFGAGNPMIVNMIIGALRPHVPEYTSMVLKELGRPEARTAVKAYIRAALEDGARTTFGAVDMTRYNQILRQYGCPNGESCKQTIAARIREADDRIFRAYMPVLLATAAAFLLLMLGRPILTRATIVVLLLFCVVLLLGGLLTPMLEVEAKISNLKMTFLGQPITFTDQVLYFQSKSVFEVFRALIDTDRADMWVVGVLVLMFSVVFPALKLLASTAGLIRPSLLRTSRVARFFALESSKWSMADVMALAIFMSYVAFNGLIGNTMNLLKQTGADLTIPTDNSKILPGYYLFVGFCIASLFVARKLAKQIHAEPRA